MASDDFVIQDDYGVSTIFGMFTQSDRTREEADDVDEYERVVSEMEKLKQTIECTMDSMLEQEDIRIKSY